MAEINVEESTCRLVQHVVSRVAITDSEYVGGHALASQRVQVRLIVIIESLLYRLLVFGDRELSI